MMSKLLHLSRYVVVLLTLVLSFGCAAQVKQAERFLFPVPPDEPRYEFIRVYSSELSFPKTRGEEVKRVMLGDTVKYPFFRPTAVAVAPNGLVYVGDTVLREVKVYNIPARKITSLANPGVIKQPLGLAIGKDGRVFVSDGEKGKVLVFTGGGNPLFSFGDKELEKPGFLTINERLKRIYVSDNTAHKVKVFDLSGKFLFEFGGLGNGPGQFYFPQGIAINKDNQLFVADQFNHRIQVLDENGKFQKEFGELGDQLWNFEMPKGVAIDGDGNLYVADARKGAVFVYRQDGRLLMKLGFKRGVHPMSFVLPYAVAVGPEDRVYITDQMNKRFVEWQYLNKAYLEQHPIK